MRQPVVRRRDPGIAHTRGGTHHLGHFIDDLCWRTFCRTEERCQVEADAHDTLLEGFGAPHPLQTGEGRALGLLLGLELLLQSGDRLFQLTQTRRICGGIRLQTGFLDGLLLGLAEQTGVHLILAEVIERPACSAATGKRSCPKAVSMMTGAVRPRFCFSSKNARPSISGR